MTMHKVLHPRDDVDRLYVSKNRKEEDSVDAAIQRFEDYIGKQRMTVYSHQKQYWQHEDQQNDNN